MTARIVRIGNSKGIRIPKLLLERTGIGDEVELEVRDRELVIRALNAPRQGWEEAFAAMARCGDDRLLDGPKVTQTVWESEEWQW